MRFWAYYCETTHLEAIGVLVRAAAHLAVEAVLILSVVAPRPPAALAPLLLARVQLAHVVELVLPAVLGGLHDASRPGLPRRC